MENEKIRIMLVDDHAVVRSGLGAFLSVMPDLELVGEAENGEEAVVRCGLLKPDVVLMDLVMPGMDGVTATRLIKEKYPCVHVLALTSFQEDGMVEGAMQAGATGYLMKNVTASELAAAIHSAHKRQDDALAGGCRRRWCIARAQARETETLTEREREVLHLMMDGLNNAQIADKLFVSLSTVKYHISNILMKLGVDNRVAAVTMALQRKLAGS